ncbi:pilus assembly protein N-terminal domain-containing protein [Hyphomonas sp.]|jgi:Flp pilus assembly secretin CpaC|uniref:pilus assembly protein N-terminal domain-containing protein n=1 Tax=Hyphomonas sp. TaxID=87 RepID=UPI0032D8F2B3
MNLFAKVCALPVAAALFSQAALAAPLSVEINKTIPVHLRSAAASVVLGNQAIADVAVHDEQLIFITGKTFGTTNLLIFDDAGRQIFSTDILVIANEANVVTVNRSGSNFTYDCAPNCRSTLSVGDDPEHFEQYIEQQTGVQGLSADN